MNSAYFTNYSLSKRKQPSLMRPEDEERIKQLTTYWSSGLGTTAEDILGQNQTEQQKLSKYIMDMPDPEQQNAVKGVSGLNLDTSRTQAIQDMYGLNKTPESITVPTTKKSSGMGTEDWIGLGLQAYGATLADKEADAERKRQEEMLSQQQMLQARAGQQQAQQFEEQMQQANRGQNMAGLQFLANQRADAMKNRTAFSFRNNFEKALRG